MERMGWGGKENSAFIRDRHKAWGLQGRRRRSGSQKDEETQAQNKILLVCLPGPPLCKTAEYSGSFHPVGPQLPISGWQRWGGLRPPFLPDPHQAPKCLTRVLLFADKPVQMR